MDRIDFGSIIILSACGMNETFFFSIKLTQKFRKIYLTFHMWNELTIFMERSDHGTKWPVTVMPLADYTDQQIKIFVTENTESDTFCIEEYTPLSSEIHCYVKNRKGYT